MRLYQESVQTRINGELFPGERGQLGQPTNQHPNLFVPQHRLSASSQQVCDGLVIVIGPASRRETCRDVPMSSILRSHRDGGDINWSSEVRYRGKHVIILRDRREIGGCATHLHLKSSSQPNHGFLSVGRDVSGAPRSG